MSPTGWFLSLFIDFSHSLTTQQLVGYRVILLCVNHLGGVNLYLTKVINKINTNKKIINDLIQENNYLEINNLLTSDIKLEDESSNNLSYTMIEFYL